MIASSERAREEVAAKRDRVLFGWRVLLMSRATAGQAMKKIRPF